MNWKDLTLFFYIVTLLSSCNNLNTAKTSHSVNDSLNNLEELEKIALSSKVTTDTVLLDYRFGMTKQEVLRHCEELYDQGKLKKDYSDNYYYEITSNRLKEVYKGFLFAEYYESRLYSIGLTFSDESSGILVFSTLSDLYTEKYGQADYMDQPLKDMDLFERIWLKNNLKIRLTSGIPYASVRYIDLRYEKKKIMADSLEKAHSQEKAKGDL